MRFLSFGLAAVLTWTLGCGGESDDRFRCGNGSCALGTQICVIAGSDRCSTCVAAPASYVASPSCAAVPPGTDAAFGDSRCIDDGVCSEVEGGAVLTCAEASWFCG